MDEIKKLANELAKKYISAYEAYKPLVEDACNRVISEKEIEYLLDRLLNVCYYEKNLELFSQLCDSYQELYPECINDYRRYLADVW